jgi:glycosyltransferase involved in cell wall biosynthesis
MAMGKPVVVTDVVEIVEDGVNGLLIPKRDPAAVAERILRLLARPDEAREFATRGREVARAHDAPAYARRLERVYDSLLT